MGVTSHTCMDIHVPCMTRVYGTEHTLSMKVTMCLLVLQDVPCWVIVHTLLTTWNRWDVLTSLFQFCTLHQQSFYSLCGCLCTTVVCCVFLSFVIDCRKKMSYVGSADHTSQTLLAATSTTGLILQDRPRSVIHSVGSGVIVSSVWLDQLNCWNWRLQSHIVCTSSWNL